jgi:hypothetical protein
MDSGGVDQGRFFISDDLPHEKVSSGLLCSASSVFQQLKKKHAAFRLAGLLRFNAQK